MARQTIFKATLLFFLVLSFGANAELNIRDVSATEAAELLKNNPEIKILDVRTGFEFNRGHLKGAVNLNYYSRKFEDNLNELDKNTTCLLYTSDAADE